ncbi:hypothetical protein M0802_012915 [Mischocyttarus mexicanus]|nr:hypothetical protein M0802_012915 [Mischocyttarus mexicanus]
MQFSHGEDDYPTEMATMKLNLVEDNWGLTYRDHPQGNQIDGFSLVIDTSKGARLAEKLRWVNDESPHPQEKTWGWGVAIRVKDYARGVLKTLVYGDGARAAVEGTSFSAHTILLTGPADRRQEGIARDYLYRPMGVDLSKG